MFVTPREVFATPPDTDVSGERSALQPVTSACPSAVGGPPLLPDRPPAPDGPCGCQNTVQINTDVFVNLVYRKMGWVINKIGCRGLKAISL